MRAWALPEPSGRGSSPASTRVACVVSSINTPETPALPSEVVVIPRGEGLSGPHLYLANDDELPTFSRAMFDPSGMGILVLRDLLIPCRDVAELDQADPLDLRCSDCGAEPWEYCLPGCAR